MKEIGAFAALEKKEKEQKTRFTEEEVNSYLMLSIEEKYKACIKNIKMTFKQDLMEGIASVDFDCLKEKSSQDIPQLIARIFSGVHVIKAQGTVVSGNGKGIFDLDQALFDGSVLPKFLVEEAIIMICKRQDPPFNPLQSSPLPYQIKRITIHPGYIMVYQ